MPYRLLIFDFDGTLANSYSWFLRVVNQAADRYGFVRIDETNREMLRGQEARQIIKHLRLPAWKAPLVARFMRKRMHIDAGEIPLYDGVERLLEQLSRQGVGLAIVSSNSEKNIRRILGPRLAGLIQHYACGGSLFGKPRLLRRVLRAAGIAPADALCIGDEIRDMRAAHEVGIPFGAVAWGYTHLDALAEHGPREVFLRVDEIARTVG